MSYVLGFATLCVCGRYWIRGSAFMAFVVTMAWLVLIVAAGGHVRNVADLVLSALAPNSRMFFIGACWITPSA